MKYSQTFLLAVFAFVIFMFFPLPPAQSHTGDVITRFNPWLYQMISGGMLLGLLAFIIFGVQCAMKQKVSLGKIFLWLVFVISVSVVSIGWPMVALWDIHGKNSAGAGFVNLT